MCQCRQYSADTLARSRRRYKQKMRIGKKYDAAIQLADRDALVRIEVARLLDIGFRLKPGITLAALGFTRKALAAKLHVVFDDLKSGRNSDPERGCGENRGADIAIPCGIRHGPAAI